MNVVDGWEYKTIDDLSVIDQESLGEHTKRDHSFYYIDISSVSEGKLRLPGDKTVFREAPSRARKVVHRGDVLMSTVRPNLKAFAYFDHTDDDCVASTGFAVLTARDQVDARFILHSILSDDVTAQIESLVVGSNYPAISSNAVRGLRVLAPPFPEQAKIAEILSTVDRAIEQTEAMIAKQQRIKTGLMQDLLTRGIDEHGNLRSEQTHQFKDSLLGRIPAEWKEKALYEVYAEVPRNGIFKTAKEIGMGSAMIGQTCFTVDRRIDYTLCRRATVSKSELTSYELQEDDILVTRVYATVDGVGLPVLVEAVPEPAVYESNMLRLRVDRDQVLPSYAFYWLMSAPVRILIMASVNASNQTSVNQQVINLIPIALPKKSEQETIVGILAESEKSIKDCNRSLRKLRSQKTGLMQDVLSGKKRVTTLLNDKEVTYL